MRKIITIAFVIGIFSLATSAFAQSGEAPLWVSGEVASIFEDRDGALISLELADGQTYNISTTREQLKDLNIGDNITVEVYKGWAELIEKADAKPQATADPKNKKRGPQWIAGDLVAIDQGAQNSLLSVKLSNDKIFNVSASNDKTSGLKIGDYITVKIMRGWAQAITKN